MRRTTLNDVARAAGVTVGTASLVLNGGRSGTRVSSETRDLICQAAERLDYRPNGLARSLRNRRSHLVGLFSDFEYLSARNPFLSELVGGLQQACSEAGFDLVLHRFERGQAPEAALERLLDRRVDAVLLYSPPANEVAQAVARSGVPSLALVDATPHLPSCTVDDAEGGRLQARYLARQGHRAVLYRAWFDPPVSAQRREVAFRAEAQAQGIEVIPGKTMDYAHRMELTDAERAALRDRATAFVGWDDGEAWRTLRTLREEGLTAGVVGFNGIPEPAHEMYDLTTVVAPWRALGGHAVRALVDQMEGRTVTEEICLPVSFHPGSTCPPPTRAKVGPILSAEAL